MKKLLLILGFVLCICSCTQQSRARKFGGEMTIYLPVGQELMEATWKEDNLFYLTRPMSPDYVPVTKTFKESSSLGVLESTVYFKETR